MGTFHCALVTLWADIGFIPLTFGHYFVDLYSVVFPIGPYTPWPNRAEGVVRVFKSNIGRFVLAVGRSAGVKRV